jgi:hypothetical protein
MKRPLIEGEDFQASIGQGEQAQGGVMGGLPNVWMRCVFFAQGNKGGEGVCDRKH